MMFQPSLIKSEKMTLWICVIDLDLVGYKLLQKIVAFMFLPAHLDLFDIVEDSFQFIETDVTSMVSTT